MAEPNMKEKDEIKKQLVNLDCAIARCLNQKDFQQVRHLNRQRSKLSLIFLKAA